MLHKPSYSLLMLALAIAFPIGNELQAGDCACHRCGCHRPCDKVCRLVEEEKKVQIVCWGCECEDFCNPGKSCRGCKNCEEVCLPDPADEKSDNDVPCSKSKNFVWYDWTPGCVNGIYTKKKLMKKTIEKKIPSYKWVVEDLCGDCQSKTVATLIEPGYIVPLPPQVEAKMQYGVQQTAAETETGNDSATAVAPMRSSANSLWPAWLFFSPSLSK